MIFVTTGTHYLSFDRLLSMMDSIIVRKQLHERVVIQAGSSREYVSNAEIIPYLSYQETLQYIASARIVVTAAGPATVFQTLQYNKHLPVVMPRLKKYGEHVSDHQLYFARYLQRKSLCVLVNSQSELNKALSNSVQSGAKYPEQLNFLVDRLSAYLSQK